MINRQPVIAVIGAGIAGLEAASQLAALGYKPVLIEKAPVVGGHVAEWNRLFPDMTPAEDVLQPLLARTANIRTLLNAEISSINRLKDEYNIILSDGSSLLCQAVLFATIIYTRKDTVGPNEWVACRGAIRNDANHISGPSRTGEGSYRALKVALGDVNPDQIAFINTHGTATVYNDEMESVAIERAGLSQVPVNGLKGYYGHTMGAAGILETILSMYAIDEHNILATRGYETLGVTHPLVVSNQNHPTDKRMFIKLLSGFGGCNAALLFAKGGMSC